ncbi:MAG TPA: rhodanese-like domain-containing protein [Telmatospirillum sp.]|nr:rhodanese-like domain-containing protein [Telmatospirillum sp.]
MSEQVKMVDVDTVLNWINADEVVVVDVRERHEFEAQHIAGAHLLPLSEFDPTRLPTVPTDKRLLLHCRSANRCGVAAAQLVASGYKGEINRLAGGMLAWLAADAPVVGGEG